MTAEAGNPEGTGALPRLAAIDVGTNSIRLIVAEAMPDGSYRLIDDEKERSQLGGGLARGGEISQEAMLHASGAIARMKSIAEGYSVEALRAVATCAVREASNRRQVVNLIRNEAGIKLDVISGDEEARLAFLSVSYAIDLTGRPVAVVDIGGGSTEVVLSSNGLIEQVVSMPLGAIRLTDQLGLRELPNEASCRQLHGEIRRVVRRHVPRSFTRPTFIVGTGGTFTSLASVLMKRDMPARSNDLFPDTVRGFEMSRSNVRQVLGWLSSMSSRDRARVPGLSQDRAEIIVAGVAIIHAVMKRLSVGSLQVHDRGIRDGLLLSMVRELYPDQSLPSRGHDRVRAMEQFAARCQYDREHCRHVAHLAIRIYDQLVEMLPDDPDDAVSGWRGAAGRDLLHVAALLHDVGYHINYQRHHKHSYHLIIHSDMAGYTQRELNIIANLARYHRQAHPKPKHGGFDRLAPEDKELVRRLAAVLRIADGFDRTHTSSVQDVTVKLEAKSVFFSAIAEKDPTVNLWGAARKSELFHKVFGLEARFHAEGDRSRMTTLTSEIATER